METQTAILNLVTSARNQEKKQEKLRKFYVPQQQQNLQSQHKQRHFSGEHNAGQNQPRSEHEIFQTNVRKQNSKESNYLKTLCVRNLNKNILEEDLHELFDL